MPTGKMFREQLSVGKLRVKQTRHDFEVWQYPITGGLVECLANWCAASVRLHASIAPQWQESDVDKRNTFGLDSARVRVWVPGAIPVPGPGFRGPARLRGSEPFPVPGRFRFRIVFLAPSLFCFFLGANPCTCSFEANAFLE